jgi:hypothetical protein
MYNRLDLKDRIPAYPGRIILTPVSGQTNTYDMTLADSPTQDGNKITAAVFAHIENALVVQDALLSDAIQGTTAHPTIVSRKVTQIVHKDSDANTVRTDTFTYIDNLITEVRTLSTGETVTLKYHTDTLETEVI